MKKNIKQTPGGLAPVVVVKRKRGVTGWMGCVAGRITIWMLKQTRRGETERKKKMNNKRQPDNQDAGRDDPALVRYCGDCRYNEDGYSIDASGDVCHWWCKKYKKKIKHHPYADHSDLSQKLPECIAKHGYEPPEEKNGSRSSPLGSRKNEPRPPSPDTRVDDDDLFEDFIDVPIPVARGEKGIDGGMWEQYFYAKASGLPLAVPRIPLGEISDVIHSMHKNILWLSRRLEKAVDEKDAYRFPPDGCNVFFPSETGETPHRLIVNGIPACYDCRHCYMSLDDPYKHLCKKHDVPLVVSEDRARNNCKEPLKCPECVKEGGYEPPEEKHRGTETAPTEPEPPKPDDDLFEGPMYEPEENRGTDAAPIKPDAAVVLQRAANSSIATGLAIIKLVQRHNIYRRKCIKLLHENNDLLNKVRELQLNVDVCDDRMTALVQEINNLRLRRNSLEHDNKELQQQNSSPYEDLANYRDD